MLFSFLPELYYKDFFDPPARKALAAVQKKATPKKKFQGMQFDDENEPPLPKKSSTGRKVTFHEKVRVKNIKPSPLRRRVLFLNNYLKSQGLKTDSDSEEEDEDEDESAEESAEEGDNGMNIDWDGMSGDDLDGSTTEEDEPDDESGRAAIERMKDDLFAEDDEDKDGPSGMLASRSTLFSHTHQTCLHTKSAWRP